MGFYKQLTIAAIAAAQAHAATPNFEPLSWLKSSNQSPVENQLLESFRYWNCYSCTMAFDGLDWFLNSTLFKNAFKAFATKTCLMTGAVPGGEEICPDMSN